MDKNQIKQSHYLILPYLLKISKKLTPLPFLYWKFEKKGKKPDNASEEAYSFWLLGLSPGKIAMIPSGCAFQSLAKSEAKSNCVTVIRGIPRRDFKMKGNKTTVAVLKHAETDLKNIHCAYRLGQATKDELYQARLRYHGLRRAWKCGILGALICFQKEMMFKKHVRI